MTTLALLLLAFQDADPQKEMVPDPFFFMRDGDVCELVLDEWGGKSILIAEDLKRMKSAGDNAGIEKTVKGDAAARIPAKTQVLVLKAAANMPARPATISGGANFAAAIQDAASYGPSVILADVRIKDGPLKDQRFYLPQEVLARMVERRALTEAVQKEIFGTYAALLAKNQKIAKQIAAKTARVKDPIEPTKLSIRKQFLLTNKELTSILQEGSKKRWPKAYRKPKPPTPK